MLITSGIPHLIVLALMPAHALCVVSFEVAEMHSDSARQPEYGLPEKWETPAETPPGFWGCTPSAWQTQGR